MKKTIKKAQVGYKSRSVERSPDGNYKMITKEKSGPGIKKKIVKEKRTLKGLMRGVPKSSGVLGGGAPQREAARERIQERFQMLEPNKKLLPSSKYGSKRKKAFSGTKQYSDDKAKDAIIGFDKPIVRLKKGKTIKKKR